MSEHILDDVLPQQNMHVWEVFRQEADGAPMIQAGQVHAPDRDLAWQYAKEQYGRRVESIRIWVVRRDHIEEVIERDILDPPMDHDYRMAKSFRVAVAKRSKLKEEFRAKADVRSEAMGDVEH